MHERADADDWRDEILGCQRPTASGLVSATDATFDGLQAIQAATAAGDKPSGAYQWLTLYELDIDNPVPVPKAWFNGPRDGRYGFSAPDRHVLLESGGAQNDVADDDFERPAR